MQLEMVNVCLHENGITHANKRSAEIKSTVYRESGVFGLMHWNPHKRILLQMLFFVV